jgi:3-deoxy-manno-octulosonate cytidylyltransferase (CMP-KDO synthetase)
MTDATLANTDTSFVVVIPARYQSTRLPGKVLADIGGKPMIQWVVEKAQLSGANKVIVATDNDEVEEIVKAFGCEVCKTRADHQSGTERLAEVMENISLAMMKSLLTFKETSLLFLLKILRKWQVT